jgi:transposase
MHIASIGIDLGKTTFHLVALGERNKIVVRKKFSRAQLLAYTANLPSSLVGLEACAGALPIHLRKNLPEVIEDAEQNLSSRLRWLLERLWQEWKQVEIDIKAITEEIERISQENALCRRLRQIPGFGPLVSTATVAAIGNGAAFRRGRDFAAWVGVVPRQYSTGGKQKLFGISKRGNIYLRRMLIHGARAVLFRIKHDTGSFGQWVHRLVQRAPHKVVVAIANKLARIAWAVLSSGKEYQHQPL